MGAAVRPPDVADTRTGIARLAIMKLHDVVDIRLDIKTIERVHEGDIMTDDRRIEVVTAPP